MRVVVVGSCNMDLIAYVNRIPESGETIMGHSFKTGCGGKGANQAVQAARLLKENEGISLIGCVGNDGFASQMRESFVKDRIDISNLFEVENSTGVAPIWVDETGDNRIIVIPGANFDFLPSHIRQPQVVELIQSCDVLVCQLEIPFETVIEAFKVAREVDSSLKRPLTILNTAPAPNKPLPHDMLSLVDILSPNETEASLIAKYLSVGDENIGTVEACNLLRAKYGFSIVITEGSKGCSIYPAASDDCIHVPSVKVDHVVDTTGAGDSFIGALSVALGRKWRLEDAAKFGCKVAARSVQSKGTQTSYAFANSLDN